MIPIFDGREMMLRTLTTLIARDAVRTYLRAEGHTLLHYKARELTAMTKTYLADNRAELVEQTEQHIMTSPALRVIWETEGLKYETALAGRARLAEARPDEPTMQNVEGRRRLSTPSARGTLS
jgi:hypothetical protein